ncbi:MAG: ATP-binding cassette domain-containing protein [Planctomycetota bacterium]|nr:ATP-binding cassette domain-containing protein [Planctomycetota bacterium]
MPLIQLQKATVAFGGPPVLDGVDLVIDRGERLALLGRNGAGKSTLLQLLQGTLHPDAGAVVREADVSIASLEQHVPADLHGTVHDLALEGSGADAHAADAAITRVGLDPAARVDQLSAGLKRRALLARALVSDPDLLLLDEPTNHLDIDSIEWLEEFLRRQNRTLLFVTHDRAFLRRLATGILDLDRGQLTRHPADYDAFLERKEAELSVEARSRRQFDRKLAEEEVWIRRGVRERRKRNQGRVRRLQDMRSEREARRERGASVRMQASSAAPSGRIVVRTENLGYGWEGAPIVSGLTTEILRGDRVGIVGPNGSGKTTLLRLLLGELRPQEGRVRLGTNLEIAYFDQLHATLDEDRSAADNVSGGDQTVRVGGRERHVVSYLGDFLFTADQARGGIRHFSGGERNRLLLARLFCRPSNLLVLDEPTNDLDVETLEVLEDLLAEYDGTILVVSHDRELLDHVVTSTLVLEDDGVVGAYVGGYSDWLAQRGDDAPRPPAPKKPDKPAPKRATSRLSREEKQALRDLPARIEKLEAGQARLHDILADPTFLKGPGEKIAEARQRLTEFDAAIAQAYARWEELESKQAGA